MSAQPPGTVESRRRVSADASAGQGPPGSQAGELAHGKVRIYRAEQGACSAQPSEDAQHERAVMHRVGRCFAYGGRGRPR